MLKHLPVQLVLCIIFALFIADYLTVGQIRAVFTVSCFLKEILMSILPIVVFSYISAAILSFEKKAPLLVITILGLVVLSNAITTFVSYGVGIFAIPLITMGSDTSLSMMAQEITPYSSLWIPQILSPDKAMMLGIAYGIVFSYIKAPIATKVSLFLQKYVTLFLEKGFIPLLPLYVFGFVLKMQYEGTLVVLLQNYGQIFAVICVLLVTFIGFMYLVASQFRVTHFIGSLKHMLPAGLTGFSSISSAVSMPVTISATEKNLAHPPFARLVIPTTVNIHMIGHGLSIPLISLAVLALSGYPLPDLESFAVFVGLYCLAKFSATAVPGGGIIVIVPILQSQLGFTPEMASLMIVLDILQDPILTSANVMGNGAFAMLSYRFCHRFKLIPDHEVVS